MLSENAGAHEELRQHAISVNPFDVSATADAMYRALTMPEEERRALGAAIRQKVRSDDIERWLIRQLDNIRELAPRPASTKSE